MTSERQKQLWRLNHIDCLIELAEPDTQRKRCLEMMYDRYRCFLECGDADNVSHLIDYGTLETERQGDSNSETD